ncbi:MAG: preprotein translocase subunit SecG [Rhizomicrobium sp.]
MQAVLLIIQLIVSVALIGVVLLQRSEGGALGMGGGGAGLGGLFSPRGAADTLTRTTAILAIAFFVTSLSLTLLALRTRPESALLPAAPLSNTLRLPLQKSPPQPIGPQLPSVPTPHQ